VNGTVVYSLTYDGCRGLLSQVGSGDDAAAALKLRAVDPSPLLAGLQS